MENYECSEYREAPKDYKKWLAHYLAKGCGRNKAESAARKKGYKKYPF